MLGHSAINMEKNNGLLQTHILLIVSLLCHHFSLDDVINTIYSLLVYSLLLMFVKSAILKKLCIGFLNSTGIQ